MIYKLELVVAHKISEPGSITKQIIKEIYSDKLAIANLTNKNPNVMYELAFRHSLGKPVIMIAEKGTPLPSDIIMERTIFYQNDAQGVLELKDNIIAAEAKIDFNKEGSPIYDVIQEFDREAQIIKISETQFVDQSDKENSNILWYILQKLNNLEDSVQAIRSLPQSEEEYIPPKRTMFVFNYEENSRPYQVKRIFDRLQKVRVVESCIIVEDVHIDEQNKEIKIFTRLMSKISVPDVYHYFEKTLSEFGFVGLKVLPRNRPYALE